MGTDRPISPRRRSLLLAAAASALGAGCVESGDSRSRVFCLLHGSTHGASGWQWLSRSLERAGHTVIAPTLPFDDESVTAAQCASLASHVLDAEGSRRSVTVVAHSISGLVLPLLGSHARVDRLVYLAAAIPRPGHSFREQFERTPEMYFPDWVEHGRRVFSDPRLARHFLYHDCPPDVVRAVTAARIRFAAKRMWTDRFALHAHPSIPTRYFAGRGDRVFTQRWMREESRRTLGVTAIDIDAGHSPHLSIPEALAIALSG